MKNNRRERQTTQTNTEGRVPIENGLPPLCVDLDGTLIRSDLLVESALALLAQRPWMFIVMLLWLLRGRAYLKQQIAAQITLDPALLPYNTGLIEWLATQRSSRVLVLCTAADKMLAEMIAAHVGLFDLVLASDGFVNLSGTNKARKLVEHFGEGSFDYVGNATVDFVVWKHARAAVVVESGTTLSARAAKFAPVERRFELPRRGLRIWGKALRLHQWIKNVLVFLPLLAAHRVLDADAVVVSLLAFICFGLCASSVYLTNDLFDLASDRQHHHKRYRPFAAGILPLASGPLMAIVLLILSFGLSTLISPRFCLALLGYYLLTTAYSLGLKKIVMLDVVMLAMLYTSRILAGAVAIGATSSFWLLAFSMFLFLSLAMVKRYAELLTLQTQGRVNASGRGYSVGDVSLVQSLGTSSGYLAVLVLALYIDSTASTLLYRHPHYLWMLCPLLLYWVGRVWAIAHRGLMHEDPVVFAMTDSTSRVIGVLAAIVVLVAV
jgi:4-hydroxybenzoate polyprenyltransferase